MAARSVTAISDNRSPRMNRAAGSLGPDGVSRATTSEGTGVPNLSRASSSPRPVTARMPVSSALRTSASHPDAVRRFASR